VPVILFSLPQWVLAIRRPHIAKNIELRRYRKEINHMKDIGGDFGERFEIGATSDKWNHYT
jgi:hypothetical protein